jgi:ribosomal protein L11 methyltransferase
MYVWRRSATRQWWSKHSPDVESIAGSRLALIERPNRKRLQIEVAARHRKEVDILIARFGGRIQKFSRNWLKQFQRGQKTKPIRVGRSKLVIPAGVAFGTGEHATTAMCLRLLERVAADLRPRWAMVDLGTGTGILALAASRLRAGHVIGIDNDPIAIATARENSRRNKIRNVTFQIADVTRYQLPKEVDVVSANLFSELLISVLPRLKRVRWLILSGILREQEDAVVRAVCRAKYDITQIRHRGKWVAILAKRSDLRTGVAAVSFQRL